MLPVFIHRRKIPAQGGRFFHKSVESTYDDVLSFVEQMDFTAYMRLQYVVVW
jgi:hypothetical protein